MKCAPEDGLIRMGTDEIRASAVMMHGKKVFGGYSVAGDEYGRSYMWTERRGMVNITPAAWKGWRVTAARSAIRLTSARILPVSISRSSTMIARYSRSIAAPEVSPRT